MKYRGLRGLGMGLLALTLCMNAGLARAQEGDAGAGKDKEQPDARAIIAKHIEAIGGEATLSDVKSQIMKGTFAVPAMGMSGSVTEYKTNDSFLEKTSMPQMGEMTKGRKGDTFWDKNAMMGSRLIEGADLEQTRRASAIFPSSRATSAICTSSPAREAAPSFPSRRESLRSRLKAEGTSRVLIIKGISRRMAMRCSGSMDSTLR